MDRLVSAFEERGYRWAYRVVNSLSFVPQRRERVFFLASLHDDPADVLFVDEVGAGSVDHDFGSATRTASIGPRERVVSGWGPDCVPTLKNGSTIGIPSPPAILFADRRDRHARHQGRRALAGIPGRLDGCGAASWSRLVPMVSGGERGDEAGCRVDRQAPRQPRVFTIASRDGGSAPNERLAPSGASGRTGCVVKCGFPVPRLASA